jgi:hypothetical protein
VRPAALMVRAVLAALAVGGPCGQHGLPELAACGYRLPGWIMARIAQLPAFLGYATQPDGNLVQIGDSYVERPQTSPRSPHLVAVYPAGYVSGDPDGDRARRSIRCVSGRVGRYTATTTT